MRFQYLDFDLQIDEVAGQEYVIQVLRSPAGEARESMRFPYDKLALENRLLTLQIALRGSGGNLRSVLSPQQQGVQDFGRALFDALIAGEVRSRYDVSLERAKQDRKGLRLRLRFKPAALAALPWEFMYDSRENEFVCLSTNTPLVRYLDLPKPPQVLSLDPPLRMLGVAAIPSDLPSLNVDNEKQRIELALKGLQEDGRLKLTWLAEPSRQGIQRALQQEEWHIIHFIGHGSFDRQREEGLIYLVDEKGGAQPVSATHLGRLLADHGSLRLVVLNACESSTTSDQDIFSSTASTLVRRGLPAVLAMQFEITDQAAIELSRAFYQALANNLPVDAAVAEARKAVSYEVNNTVEWGTPVLYMRSPDGRIFDLSAPVAPPVSPDQVRPQAEPKQKSRAPRKKPAPKPEPSRSEPPPREAPLPGLDERYSQALEHFYLDRWSEASAFFGEIVAQQPDYLDAAPKFEHAQRQQTLATRYAEASKAYDATQWAAAIDHSERVQQSGARSIGRRRHPRRAGRFVGQ